MLRIVLLSFFLVTGMQGAAHAVDRRSELDKAVQSLVHLYSDGSAISYPEFQHVRFAKIFNSKIDDAVVFFALEGFHGGNAQSEFLAFFAAVNPEDWPEQQLKQYRLVAVQQIGGRGWRSFDFDTAKVKADSVQIQGKAWAGSDAGCCPSLPILAKFSVKKGSVEEAK